MILLQIATALHGFAWGVYFAYTRRLFSETYGAGYLALLTGLEWAAALLSVFFGYLRDRYRGSWPLYVGASGAAPFVALAVVDEPVELALLLSLSNAAWSAAWPAIVSGAADKYGSSASVYARWSIGLGIGWGLGSAASGFVASAWGVQGVVLSMVAPYVAAYCLFIYELRDIDRVGSSNSISLSSLASLLRSMYLFSAAVVVSVFSRELIYVYATKKFSDEVTKLFGDSADELFGLLYAVGVVVSAPSRVVAGKLADRVSPGTLLISVLAAYALFGVGMHVSSGWSTIILWQLPLFPFMDVSLTGFTLKIVPSELRGSSIGIVTALSSLGGLMLVFTEPLFSGDQSAAIYLPTLLMVASAVLYAAASRIPVKSSAR